MKYCLIPIITVSISLAGCGNEDALPEILPKTLPKTFYTISVDPAYTGGMIENWVFATDSNGELLDGRSFIPGDEVQLESTTEVKNNFNIHFLAVDQRSDKPYLTLTTFNEVDANGSWKLVNPLPENHTEANVTGEVQIKILNYPDQSDVSFSDNIKISGPMGNQITSMTMSGTTVDVAVALTDNNSNLILSFSKYRHAYYTEIMAPVSGSQITLDAELDLKQVEKEFTLYFTESIYTYIGFYGYKIGDDAANTGYIISERVDNDGNMFGGFGEINGFDLYRTVISFKQDNYSRTYYKLGSAMEYNPYFGQPLTSVSKPLIADFSAMVGVPYLKSSIFFDNPASGDLEWEVVSPRSQVIPELKFMIKEVPTELKAKYPSLNLNEISFNHGSAVQYMDDFTYKDFILYRSNINDAVKRASNEYYYYEWE